MRNADIILLTSLGLSKSESIIYLDIIFNGLSSVIEIANRVKIHRPNVYDSIRKLREMGIVIEILEENSKKYKSIEPKKLKLYLKQKEEELDKFIKDLDKINQKKKSSEETVAVLKGISIKREFLNILDSKKPIFISMNPELEIEDTKFLKELDKKRVQNKIPLKIILSKQTPNIKEFENLSYSQTKIMEFVSIPNLASIVVGNTFYYLQKKGNDFNLIKIVNEDIAKEKQTHFNYAWNKK